jgi:thiamine transport system substrate-binding protein
MKRIATFFATIAIAAGCSSTTSTSNDTTPDTASDPVTLTLLAHDSFAYPDGIFDAFTAATGVNVEVVLAGDAGELVTKAVLTSGNPEGDVLWGVDNTLLSRALDADVFVPYASANLDSMSREVTIDVPGHEVTPVDTGDVCINYDVQWFEEEGLTPPGTLESLTNKAFANRIVVPSPLTSSPGLAFLLATIAEFGEGRWQEFWSTLRDNGVLVVDGWTEAYTVEFSGSSGKGAHPIVVSYGSSPPAEVIYANPPVTTAPTAVAALTCFAQIEYAGILRGSKNVEEAKLLIDYLTDIAFQETLPLSQFVYPVNGNATLPQEFLDYAVKPENPLRMAPDVIAKNRTRWLDEWKQIVVDS